MYNSQEPYSCLITVFEVYLYFIIQLDSLFIHLKCTRGLPSVTYTTKGAVGGQHRFIENTTISEPIKIDNRRQRIILHYSL